VTGGKPNENDLPDKYNSVNIGDEEVQIKEENERLKKEIEKERKIAFNACNILKMEIEYIGNFFFGKKKEKNSFEKIKKSYLSYDKNTFSDEEADDEGEDEGEDEEDYTLSKFYQSNTREDLQNQLKNINFEDEDDENLEEKENEIKDLDCEMKKSDLLSGSDEEKQPEEEKEFTIESGGRNKEVEEDSEVNNKKGKFF